MARTVSARALALLALLGAVLAVVLVVSSAGGGSAEGTGASTTSDVTGSATTTRDDAGTATTTTGAGASGGPRFYTVQDGDVLSAIADETGVPLARIEELNPDLDAQTLQTGQRIKLRP